MFGYMCGYRHYITPRLPEPQIKQNAAGRTWLRTGNGEQIHIKAKHQWKGYWKGCISYNTC